MKLELARSALGLLALVLLSLASAARRGEAADFYEGKTLTMVGPARAGSTYDLYARLLAEYMPKYIPGHPVAIVQNMDAASGLASARFVYNAAPRDGTTIGIGTGTLPSHPLLHPDVATFDVTKFSWIGSVTTDGYVAYVRDDAPVQTYEETKQKQIVIGGLTLGSPSFDLPVISNALFGTKFKIVAGYEGENTVGLAVERGEVQGSFGGNYNTIKSALIDYIGAGKIRFILQCDLTKLLELPDVPMFIDQAKTLEEREILDFILSPTQFSKPFYAPPGIPADRLDILRRAFDSAVKDPGFLAAAAKSNISVRDPMNGQELTAAVAKVVSTPPAVVERIKSILRSFQQN